MNAKKALLAWTGNAITKYVCNHYNSVVVKCLIIFPLMKDKKNRYGETQQIYHQTGLYMTLLLSIHTLVFSTFKFLGSIKKQTKMIPNLAKPEYFHTLKICYFYDCVYCIYWLFGLDQLFLLSTFSLLNKLHFLGAKEN